MEKYIFIADYKAAYPEPACRKANPPCMIAQKAPRLFKKGEVIEGTPKFASVQCIKAPCPAGTTLVGISVPIGRPPMPNEKMEIQYFTIPMNVLSPLNKDNQTQFNKEKEQESRDVWTGGVEWNKIFSVLNFWRLVIFCLFLYLFLKYLLPLIKQSLKKEG